MFDHKQIWAAFEVIAKECGLSLSALSKSAGLDPTSFNPSKRFGPGGRERWPSTETLANVLKVAGMDMKTFAEVLEARAGPGAARPQSTRRLYKRFQTILEGRLRFDPNGPQVRCTIRDISASGARLWLHEPAEFPGEIELEIPGLEQSRRVRLVWSRDNSYGVMFLEELRQRPGDDVSSLVNALQTPDDWESPEARTGEVSPLPQETPRKRERGRRGRSIPRPRKSG